MLARLRVAMFLSLLDLVSCALGAAILLAVIFSIIEKPIVSPKSEDFLAAEFRTDRSVQLGIALYHSQTNQYVLLTPNQELRQRSLEKLKDLKMADDIEWFSVSNPQVTEGAAPSYVSVSGFVMLNPRQGDWFVTPYIYSFDDEYSPKPITKIQSRWSTRNYGREYCEENFDNGFSSRTDQIPRLLPQSSTPGDVDLSDIECQGKSAFIVTL